jgi:hypothetical protein
MTHMKMDKNLANSFTKKLSWNGIENTSREVSMRPMRVYNISNPTFY